MGYFFWFLCREGEFRGCGGFWGWAWEDVLVFFPPGKSKLQKLSFNWRWLKYCFSPELNSVYEKNYSSFILLAIIAYSVFYSLITCLNMHTFKDLRLSNYFSFYSFPSYRVLLIMWTTLSRNGLLIGINFILYNCFLFFFFS